MGRSARRGGPSQLFLGVGMFSAEALNIVRESVGLWNETEEILKKAELLSGTLVVPGITELRYAGRKLVDYMLSCADCHEQSIIDEHIQDYKQCCIRARHDAVDASVMFIKNRYNHAVETFGPDVVHSNFRHNVELRRAIRIVDERLSLSRKERHDRPDLYSEVNDKHLDGLIQMFRDLEDSEEPMIHAREQRDRSHRFGVRGFVVGVLGGVVGVVGLVAAFYFAWAASNDGQEMKRAIERLEDQLQAPTPEQN